jgi:hypothetical protein
VLAFGQACVVGSRPPSAAGDQSKAIPQTVQPPGAGGHPQRRPIPRDFKDLGRWTRRQYPATGGRRPRWSAAGGAIIAADERTINQTAGDYEDLSDLAFHNVIGIAARRSPICGAAGSSSGRVRTR